MNEYLWMNLAVSGISVILWIIFKLDWILFVGLFNLLYFIIGNIFILYHELNKVQGK